MAKAMIAAALKGLLLIQGPWPTQTYHSESFTAPGIVLQVNSNTGDGYLFYGLSGTGYISPSPIIMENSGELVWHGPPVHTHNFQVQKYGDQNVLTWWHGHTKGFGHGYGSIAILDNSYRVIHEVCLKDNLVTPNASWFPGNYANPCYFDGHESYITNRGTVIGTAFNVTRADLSQFGGPTDGWIFDALFYEVDIKTNKVLFRWSALEHVPISKSNYFGHDISNPLAIGSFTYGNTRLEPWDFFHINSVQPIDGGYLVNSRMTWSFYKINGSTGAVEWTLEGSHGGDFSLEPGIFWSWQHMPRMHGKHQGDLLISVFNNDNINRINKAVNQTSGYLLRVDEKRRVVTAMRKLVDDVDPVYATAEGSYQALPDGHVVMGYGSNAIIKEFDKDNNVVYNAQFAPLTKKAPDSDLGKDVHSYRAFRFQWDANPAHPPKVAAFFADNDDVLIYMSWNGATMHNQWNVYAGTDQHVMHKIASNVRRTGFETEHVIVGGAKKYQHIQVEAVGAKAPLRKSTITPIKEKKTVSEL